jgi:hypothetical protein
VGIDLGVHVYTQIEAALSAVTTLHPEKPQ